MAFGRYQQLFGTTHLVFTFTKVTIETMIKQLLRHDWLSFRRSPIFGQEILKTIFLGLFGLYMMLSFASLGFFLEDIIDEVLPGADHFKVVGKGILYYFLIDLLLRTMIQKFPILDIRKYLARPISKSTLAHFVMTKSIRSFYNFMPLFFVVPYFLRSVLGAQSTMVALSFLFVVVGLIMLANFGGFALDKFFKTKTWVALVLVGAIIVTLYLDFSGRIGLGIYFESFFTWLTSNPIFALLPMVLVGVVYYFLHNMLKNNTYLEDLDGGTTNMVTSAHSLGFSRWFGQAGHLMDLETKLILRSKRSKMFLIISGFMLLYPLIFLGNPAFEMMGMKIFVGLFVTGMFAMNYGQLLLSWNSPHFDLLLTRNLSIEDIFKAKYYLLVGSIVVLMTLFSVYFFIDRQLFYIGLVMFLYNAGLTIYMYMILASFNSKRIDPSKGAMMNYEGIGAGHFLIIIPVFLIPYLIYKLGDLAGYPNAGFAIIAILGILGFVLHEPIIKRITKLFFNNKYKISAAFRNKS